MCCQLLADGVSDNNNHINTNTAFTIPPRAALTCEAMSVRRDPRTCSAPSLTRPRWLLASLVMFFRHPLRYTNGSCIEDGPLILPPPPPPLPLLLLVATITLTCE